jgi:RNA polymerase sigma-70 factor, ECF subfamily
MPASQHPVPRPSSLPPSAFELGEDALGWGEESAVFELPAPRPLPASAFDDSPVRPEASLSEATTLPAPALEAGPLPPDLGDVGRLFNDYRAYVAKIGRRILGPCSEVDDLIQDVFLTTVRDAHKIKDPARLGSWLGTVTTRMAKRRRFRTSHQPLASDALDSLVDVATADDPGPESTADLTGNIRKLLSLPDELRTPWLLKHVEGHTLEDVAKQCDCSLSTAARRIQSASDRLSRRR